MVRRVYKSRVLFVKQCHSKDQDRTLTFIMKHIATALSLICVLVLGVHSQFSDTDFEEIESKYYNRPATTLLPRTTTPKRHAGNARPFWSTTEKATLRPKPTSPAPVPPRPITVAPRNPGIDGNGQLIGCPCVSTHETNPVCGTDGNTYGNPAKLKCAQRCGHLVEENYGGSCAGRG